MRTGADQPRQLSLIYRWRKHVPDEIAERYPILVLTDVWSRASDLSLGEANRIIDELLARWGRAAATGRWATSTSPRWR